jgi:hypothetical protein
MGKGIRAECRCGCKGTASVGSSRAMHGKIFEFPHWCSGCKDIVSVDLLQRSRQCPKCENPHVTSFAATSVRAQNWLAALMTGKWLNRLGFHALEQELASGYCFRLQKTFTLLRREHLCHLCQQMSMTFFIMYSFD